MYEQLYNEGFHDFYSSPYIVGVIKPWRMLWTDRLCGLVVRVFDYRCRGPEFDSRALQKSSGSGTGSTHPREYN
jgi:hypothetical protein